MSVRKGNGEFDNFAEGMPAHAHSASCVTLRSQPLACLETGPVPAYSHALERRSGPAELPPQVLSLR